jgi:hypothetical protein
MPKAYTSDHGPIGYPRSPNCSGGAYLIVPVIVRSRVERIPMRLGQARRMQPGRHRQAEVDHLHLPAVRLLPNQHIRRLQVAVDDRPLAAANAVGEVQRRGDRLEDGQKVRHRQRPVAVQLRLQASAPRSIPSPNTAACSTPPT